MVNAAVCRCSPRSDNPGFKITWASIYEDIQRMKASPCANVCSTAEEFNKHYLAALKKQLDAERKKAAELMDAIPDRTFF